MEWKLIMKYIANYPVILENSTKDINDSSIKLNFHSNKVSLYDKNYPNYLNLFFHKAIKVCHYIIDCTIFGLSKSRY